MSDQAICPICRQYFDKDQGSGVYENLTPATIGWETCSKQSCVEKVKQRNLENHKKWFPNEHE